MEIIFSRHAKLKIEERRIPRQMVIGAVRFPDARRPGQNLRQELYKRFRGLYLKVVIKKEREKIIVITAHLVVKIKNK